MSENVNRSSVGIIYVLSVSALAAVHVRVMSLYLLFLVVSILGGLVEDIANVFEAAFVGKYAVAQGKTGVLDNASINGIHPFTAKTIPAAR